MRMLQVLKILALTSAKNYTYKKTKDFKESAKYTANTYNTDLKYFLSKVTRKLNNATKS